VSVRPTGDQAYADGRGTFHPPERRIVRGAEIRHEKTVRVDACVIGTGAGGAAVAKELAEGGMSVAMLEEGEWHDTDDFTARPREMTARLYRDAGQTTTLGNTPIVLPLGRMVGGTTAINSGTCFRTPEPVLAYWRETFGLEALTGEALEPYFRRVERTINVAQVPAEIAGPNARLIAGASERLGWSGDYIFRNAKGCVGSGVCAFGCPAGAKQHVGITYVPRAWAAGATTYTGTTARRIAMSGHRARGVDASTAGGGWLHVEAEHVIVACGAIHTPAFLARQGLGLASGELGRNLAIHPATAVRALMDEEVRQWEGVPQSYFIDEFADEGIMFEGATGPPDYFAMTIEALGPEHHERMAAYPRMSQFGLMVSDTSRGRVREALGRPQIHYDVNLSDVATFKRGLELLTELYWEAGAREVLVPVAGVPPLRAGDSGPLQRAEVRARDLTLMAFHPLGSARAGADPARAVLDGDLRVHGVAGLHVADGSAVPSSLGVNPQITIMSLATRLAFHLLGASAPADEPAPERIAEPRISMAHVAA
jgi:choline dehydrogenase-like flavoprotein